MCKQKNDQDSKRKINLSPHKQSNFPNKIKTYQYLKKKGLFLPKNVWVKTVKTGLISQESLKTQS